MKSKNGCCCNSYPKSSQSISKIKRSACGTQKSFSILYVVSTILTHMIHIKYSAKGSKINLRTLRPVSRVEWISLFGVSLDRPFVFILRCSMSFPLSRRSLSCQLLLCSWYYALCISVIFQLQLIHIHKCEGQHRT